jgi:hypothetical protein
MWMLNCIHLVLYYKKVEFGNIRSYYPVNCRKEKASTLPMAKYWLLVIILSYGEVVCK